MAEKAESRRTKRSGKKILFKSTKRKKPKNGNKKIPLAGKELLFIN